MGHPTRLQGRRLKLDVPALAAYGEARLGVCHCDRWGVKEQRFTYRTVDGIEQGREFDSVHVNVPVR